MSELELSVWFFKINNFWGFVTSPKFIIVSATHKNFLCVVGYAKPFCLLIYTLATIDKDRRLSAKLLKRIIKVFPGTA